MKYEGENHDNQILILRALELILPKVILEINRNGDAICLECENNVSMMGHKDGCRYKNVFDDIGTVVVFDNR